MKKIFISLGRFTMKLVSLLVICGLVSVACLPLVHAENDSTDLGDAVSSEEGCHPKTEETMISAQNETDDDDTEPTTPTEPVEPEPTDPEPAEFDVTIKYINIKEPHATLTSDEVLTCKIGKYIFTPKEIEGYFTPEAQIIEVKAGCSVTFEYTQKATLTVYYRKAEDGSEAAPTYTEEIAVDAEYSVTSPSVDGYNPNKAEVSGTMSADGAEETVTYFKNVVPPTEYTVTIQYHDEDGANIADDETKQLTAGEHTIIPKSIDGYITPESQTVEILADTTVTFTYKKSTTNPVNPVDPEPTKYTITIHYLDAEGKPIAGVEDGSQECAVGECEIIPIDITGYITPAKKTITVSADSEKEVTFNYEKKPTTSDDDNKGDDEPGDDDNNGDDDPTAPDNPGDDDNKDDDKPGTDKPGDGDDNNNDDNNGDDDSDPKPPVTDPSDQNPSDQKPTDQDQNQTIVLPVTGPSDELIRNFLVLDAEVSAGGLGLWAVSGIIRRIRRR